MYQLNEIMGMIGINLLILSFILFVVGRVKQTDRLCFTTTWFGLVGTAGILVYFIGGHTQ